MRTEGIEALPHPRRPVRGAQENVSASARGRRDLACLEVSSHPVSPRLGADCEVLQFAVKMLRMVSWNINGIRSPLQGMVYEEPSNCAAMAMGRILDKLDADIVCLQETKVTSERSKIQDPYHTLSFPVTFVPCLISFYFTISLSVEPSS